MTHKREADVVIVRAGTRRFSGESLSRLLAVSSQAARIRECYEAFRGSQDGLEAWVGSVRPLWDAGGHAQAG